jgi:hypothetical protein
VIPMTTRPIEVGSLWRRTSDGTVVRIVSVGTRMIQVERIRDGRRSALNACRIAESYRPEWRSLEAIAGGGLAEDEATRVAIDEIAAERLDVAARGQIKNSPGGHA